MGALSGLLLGRKRLKESEAHFDTSHKDDSETRTYTTLPSQTSIWGLVRWLSRERTHPVSTGLTLWREPSPIPREIGVI